MNLKTKQYAIVISLLFLSCKSIKTITIQPDANPTETVAQSQVPTYSVTHTTTLPVLAWTAGGTPFYLRAYIRFDLSNLPANATILDASLSLHSLSQSEYTRLNKSNLAPQSGESNACYVSRITTPWTDNTVYWNNKPGTTITNEVLLPQTKGPEEDALDINVTALVKDMLREGNYGFAIGLKDEQYYNCRDFASSVDVEPFRHPKLVIRYR